MDNMNIVKGSVVIGENTFKDQDSKSYPLSFYIVLSDGLVESNKWTKMVNILKRSGKKNVHFKSDSFPTVRMTYGYSVDAYFANYEAYKDFIEKVIHPDEMLKRSNITDTRETLLERAKIIFKNRANNISTPFEVRLAIP